MEYARRSNKWQSGLQVLLAPVPEGDWFTREEIHGRYIRRHGRMLPMSCFPEDISLESSEL